MSQVRPTAREVVDEGSAEAFIPYFDVGKDLENVPMSMRPDLYYYRARLGFLTNEVKIQLHAPWIAEQYIRLNNAIMRDERNTLDEELKYTLSAVISSANECEYCTVHHAGIFKERWGKSDEDLEAIFSQATQPDSEPGTSEALAIEFARQASLDPRGVTDDLRRRLADEFSPQEVMEIVLVVGFWNMMNVITSCTGVPLEEPMLPFAGPGGSPASEVTD